MSAWETEVRSALHEAGHEINEDIVVELSLHAEAAFNAEKSSGADDEAATARVQALIADWTISAELLKRRPRRPPLPRSNPHADVTLGHEGKFGTRLRFIFESAIGDLRYALRGLAAAPGFTSVALLSLALGIGATTAMFSLVYGVLLSPYPCLHPDGIWLPETLGGRHAYTVQEFRDLQNVSALASVMATRQDYVQVTGDSLMHNVSGALVSANAFEFLGVDPELGRTILPGDVDGSGRAQPVVVLSHIFWRRIFQEDRTVVGNILVLNDVSYRIVGVMPQGFVWYGNGGVWRPLGFEPNDGREVDPLMRLAPGVSKDAAQLQLHTKHLQWTVATPAAFPQARV